MSRKPLPPAIQDVLWRAFEALAGLQSMLDAFHMRAMATANVPAARQAYRECARELQTFIERATRNSEHVCWNCNHWQHASACSEAECDCAESEILPLPR